MEYEPSFQDAIARRRSRRSYTAEPIGAELAQQLQQALDAYNEAGNIDMRMVLGNSEAWNGVKNSYGMFSGVSDYLGLIARADDQASYERMGYYGEAWVLKATSLGLGTCWVASSFSRNACPFELKDGEEIICAISFGHIDEELSGREKFIKRLTGSRKSKSVEDMLEPGSGPIPAWFRRGMEAVQKAPSAVNRQPVMFRYKDGVASASVANPLDKTMGLDFGIAKLHFEVGVGGGTWEWGNGGAFHIDESSQPLES